MPHHRMFRVAYGSALLQAGKAREAANEFEAALESDRTFKPALDGLMAAQARAR
jgi:hypothetical protein